MVMILFVVLTAYRECKLKAMDLTNNIFTHIHFLSESKQKLYRRCTAVAREVLMDNT
jgi:hypothetical protein